MHTQTSGLRSLHLQAGTGVPAATVIACQGNEETGQNRCPGNDKGLVLFPAQLYTVSSQRRAAPRAAGPVVTIQFVDLPKLGDRTGRAAQLEFLAATRKSRGLGVTRADLKLSCNKSFFGKYTFRKKSVFLHAAEASADRVVPSLLP
eukprot:27862-Hanusia_phi.AAC.1